MTLSEVEAIYAYWQDHPPTHLLVGALLGAGPSALARGAPQTSVRSQMLEIQGMKEGAVDQGPTPAALEFTELKRRYEEKR